MEIKAIMKSFTIVDRDQFLRSVLAGYLPFAVVEEAVVKGIEKANVDDSILHQIAQQRIQKYSTQAGAASFLTTSVGGILMLPLDYAQFFSNCAMLIQELYYLYGVHTAKKLEKKEDVEMLFYMMIGASTTVKTTGSVMNAFAKYLIKKTGKKAFMKMVPAIGSITSSSFSYLSLRSIAYEFIEQMKLMRENHILEEEPLMQQIEEFIDVEYKEAETAFRSFCNLEKLKELQDYADAGYISNDEYEQMVRQID